MNKLDALVKALEANKKAQEEIEKAALAAYDKASNMMAWAVYNAPNSTPEEFAAAREAAGNAFVKVMEEARTTMSASRYESFADKVGRQKEILELQRAPLRRPPPLPKKKPISRKSQNPWRGNDR